MRNGHKTILVDLLCYCGGLTLTSASVPILYANYGSRDWNGDTRNAFLGGYRSVPVFAWWVMVLFGILLFVCRWVIKREKRGDAS